ncbi:MAG: hypothetical protein OHK0039_34380 [Bacteroidia bacterium]
MQTHSNAASAFDAQRLLHDVKHYLPAQAPLKDFIHHNTLHAFQDQSFFDALRQAACIFGYKTLLSLDDFRALYRDGRIREDVLRRVIEMQKGSEEIPRWIERAIGASYPDLVPARIGRVRAYWKRRYAIDLDAMVHPLLFRMLCSYLDQGISIWDFPVRDGSLLDNLRALEGQSLASLFRGRRARRLLLDGPCDLRSLLDLLVGDERYYASYVFDQQFAHQGWSGIVSSIEDRPQGLLDGRHISLHDLVVFELLLEIDAADHLLGEGWQPLGTQIERQQVPLFDPVPWTERDEVRAIWQAAFEWTYYDEVLAAIQQNRQKARQTGERSFQALFCIDDREGSFRRYLEQFDAGCETYGTPGFFGVDAYYRPDGGKHYTQICPAPMTPRHLIEEHGSPLRHDRDAHFSKHTHSFHSGWLIAQTLGFWSALRLFAHIFMPSASPATASSMRHMAQQARLTVEAAPGHRHEDALQVGFEVGEMIDRVEQVLKGIGLVKDFAPIVYVVGHGASSVNNPHYAAYDCGACSGRAGSVNARAFAHMCNHPEVRAGLPARGIEIPADTWFVGALRDTTRDEIVFFDEALLPPGHLAAHRRHVGVFHEASSHHAKERARRFASVDMRLSPARIHRKILRRSVSLFEPRPELNHATNALCIVGRREMTEGIFFDRRAFFNSYDYQVDPTGQYLLGILRAATPVCGGINLEYYFSRVDNQKLGAGTKLPHNVMGLIGVANGIDGDLRPGLPSQMIEVHDPLRLLMIVEHDPAVVLQTIRQDPATYAWFQREWVHLVVVAPESRALFRFEAERFVPYLPLAQSIATVEDLAPVIEAHRDNLPVFYLS